MTHVRLGVCTYNRPDGLAELFATLPTLEVPDGVRFDVVVVDNDREPSSEALVAELAKGLPFDCGYANEPQPGIPSARNRVLDEARDADFLLFVDDDEIVTSNLLVEHLRVQKLTGAGFVQGPCKMTSADPAQSWWLESVFFRQRTFEDGSPRHESWTNNVMIDMKRLLDSGVRFDDRLRFSGGSDTLFFQDFVRQGATGAYAARAFVEEVQPDARLTWAWALRRQYRYGVTRANTMMLREAKPAALAKCVLRGLGMITVGLGHLPTALFLGRLGLANSSAYLARGGGIILGALGFRAEEYARA